MHTFLVCIRSYCMNCMHFYVFFIFNSVYSVCKVFINLMPYPFEKFDYNDPRERHEGSKAKGQEIHKTKKDLY